jgi:hypothetical protein
VVAGEPLDVKTLDAVMPWITVEGYEVLLDALTASDHRATRRKLLDRLAPTHLPVASLIGDRLQDERWYVQRNLLLLLERLGQLPPDFSPDQWMQHRDARVRYQALALLLAVPAQRSTALRSALEDRDERIARLGLAAAHVDCPRSLIPLVAHFATNSRVQDDLRIQAVKALAATRDDYALATLTRLAQSGRAIFGRSRQASPVVHATLKALAATKQTGL